MNEEKNEKKKCKNCYYIQQGFCLCADSKKVSKFVLFSSACELYSRLEPKQVDSTDQTIQP